MPGPWRLLECPAGPLRPPGLTAVPRRLTLDWRLWKRPPALRQRSPLPSCPSHLVCPLPSRTGFDTQGDARMQPRKSGRRLSDGFRFALTWPTSVPTPRSSGSPHLSSPTRQGSWAPAPPGLALLRLPPAKGGDSSYGGEGPGVPLSSHLCTPLAFAPQGSLGPAAPSVCARRAAAGPAGPGGGRTPPSTR